MSERDGNLLPRPVRDSQSEMVEVVLPNDANPLGNLLGGRLMHLIDVAAALACHRHARSYVVTASTDHHVTARVTMAGERGSDVNQMHEASPEQVAERVGVVGQHHFHHLRL